MEAVQVTPGYKMIVPEGAKTRRVGAQIIVEGDKEYKVHMRLGILTDTLDCTGKILEETPVKDISIEIILDALKKFMGRILQKPPAFSAIKVKGVPLYKLARRGESVSVKPREVFIYCISLVSFNLPDVELIVRCSKGTYIRSLVRDIGELLRCGATLTGLIRTKVGKFAREDAYNMEIIKDKIASGGIKNIIIPLNDHITNLPSVYLEDNLLAMIRRGKTVLVKPPKFAVREAINIIRRCNVCDKEGKIIAIGELLCDGDKRAMVKPKRVIVL